MCVSKISYMQASISSDVGQDFAVQCIKLGFQRFFLDVLNQVTLGKYYGYNSRNAETDTEISVLSVTYIQVNI